jgi:hypothetical protein
MPHLRCPECELRLDGRSAMELDCCPRCVVRGHHVRLEAELGPLFATPRPTTCEVGLVPSEAAVATAMRSTGGRLNPRRTGQAAMGTEADGASVAGNRLDRPAAPLPGAE